MMSSTQEPLDAELTDLLEAVWACERQWTIDDHVNAVIKYGRPSA